MGTIHAVLTSTGGRSVTGSSLGLLHSRIKVDNTPINAETITVGGTSTQGEIQVTSDLHFAQQTVWAVTASGGSAWVAFGADPTAVAESGHLILSGQTRVFGCVAGDKIAVIEASVAESVITGIASDGSVAFTGAQEFIDGTAANPSVAIGSATKGLFGGGSGATEFIGGSANGAEVLRFTAGGVAKVSRDGSNHLTASVSAAGIATLTASGAQIIIGAAGTAALPGLAVGAATVGLFSGGSGATEYVGISANGAEYARFTGGAIDCRGGNAIHLFGGDTSSATTRTDATNKQFLIGCPHRTNAQPALLAISAFSSAGTGQVLIGGGQSSRNAATQVSIHAAANNTTTIGTEMVRCTIAGVRIQSGVSAAASDLLQVYSTTNSNTILQCNEATSSIFGCGATSAAGARAMAFGLNSVAGGNSAFAAGSTATASGNSSVALGSSSLANASSAIALGSASSRGVVGRTGIAACESPISGSYTAQISHLNVAVETTDATPTVLRSNTSAAATTNQLTLQNNSAYFVVGRVVATKTAAGDSSCWEIKALIKRGANAASTTLEGTADVTMIKQAAGAATWAVAATADTTNGALTITVTGQAATTIRWNCYLNPVEVSF